MDEQEIRDQVRIAQGEAARRTLAILTEWALRHPTSLCVLHAAPNGKIEIEIDRRVVFRGESLQDACAQAAQTIQFNDGEL